MLSAIERKTTRLLVDYRGSHWKRRTRINPPVTLLGQRWFSQNKDNDDDNDKRKPRKFNNQRDPLLRAFETEDVSKNTSSSSQQYELDKNQRNRPKYDKRTSMTNSAPPTRKNTVSSSTETKATLADFFADLGANSKASRPTTTKDGAGDSRILGGNVLSGARPPNQSKDSGDVSSFFDKVDAIMKRNEELKTSLSSSSNETISSTPHERIASTSLQSASSSLALANGGRRSILDMFPPQKPRGPNAYDEDMFEQYSEMLERIMSMPTFFRRHTKKPLEGDRAQSIIDWLESEEPSIPCQLPLLEKALTKEGLSQEETLHAMELFRNEMNAQREAFLQHHGWDEDQYNNAQTTLTKIGDLCAKTGNAKPLDIAWKKFKEGGFPMKSHMLYNYLYVAATFSTRSATRSLASLPSGGVGSSILEFLAGPVGIVGASAESSKAKEIVAKAPLEIEDVEETFEDLPSEIANCHDFLYKPSEQSLMIRVRMLVMQGKARMAEQLLDDNSEDILKLRTYLPVFSNYVEEGDVSAAFQLYIKMKNTKGGILLSENYIQLMACIAENGFFSPNAPSIEGAEKNGYTHASGPRLFDQLASELAAADVQISSASARRLYSAFQRGYRENESVDSSGLDPLYVLEPLKTCNAPARPNEFIASRVTIDRTTGRCPRSGARLRLIDLDSDQKKQLQEGLVALATTNFEAFSKLRKSDTAADSIKQFGEWLDNREGEPFTAIIDGPNVAYYMQNFDGGQFNIHQLKLTVDALETMGEHVLVILPQKYSQKQFSLPSLSGGYQKQTPAERAILDELKGAGKLFLVRSGCLDDLYWMYASVSSQERSRQGRDLYIAPGNADGRWPGSRPMLISNDLMRDHKLALLEPRLFRRWSSNYIVNFTFSAFVGDKCFDREIGFSTADFYSREIQGNRILTDDGVDGGITWHFPVSDWEENESFCIRIPR